MPYSTTMKAHLTLALLVCTLLGCDSSGKNEGPARQDAVRTVPSFDGEKAFEMLQAQTNLGPRNPGSAGHRECRKLLASTLAQYADSIHLLPFAASVKGATYYGTNIVARFGGTTTGRILLSAHWDTRPTADEESDAKKRSMPILGANDGASGVAVLLEMARLMSASPPPIGVDIVLFDLEDVGTSGVADSWSLGARDFAKNHLRKQDYSYAVNFDMIGDARLEIRRERNSDISAASVLDRIFSTARLLGISEFVDEPGHTVTDDHIPLIEAGLPAVNLIDFDYPDASNSYWHTLQDTPDKCSPRSLGAVGAVIVQIIYASKAS